MKPRHIVGRWVPCLLCAWQAFRALSATFADTLNRTNAGAFTAWPAAQARNATPFAVEVVESTGTFGTAPHDDVSALLGMPSTDFHDAWGALFGGQPRRKVKLVEPAYGLDPTQTGKLITTLGEGSSVVVRFEEPITDDPSHPYGIDLLVFGNGAYATDGMVDDASDMNTLRLTGGGYFEAMKISVSPGFTGAPGQSPTQASSWSWHRFDKGPFADGAFPTQAYPWIRTNSTWGTEPMDFTKPVNPAFGARLETGGLSAADAIDLYDGSGGGTGFDLAESGFPSIRYVRIEGLPGFSGGEIDALAAVRPAILGDSLALAAQDASGPGSSLRFLYPARPFQTAVSLHFTRLAEDIRVSTEVLSGADGVAPAFGRSLVALGIRAFSVPGNRAVACTTDLRIHVDADYDGNGTDLVLLRRVEGEWKDARVNFDPATRDFALPEVTLPSQLALVQSGPPRLVMASIRQESGEPRLEFRISGLPGFTYVLQRSESPNFRQVEDVATHSPVAAREWTALDAFNLRNAFYRVRSSRP